MKIYCLRHSSGDIDSCDGTLAEFPTMEAAEAAKKNIEDYVALETTINDIKSEINGRYVDFSKEYGDFPESQPVKKNKYSGDHMRKLCSIISDYVNKGDIELAEEARKEYQEKCEFNRTVNSEYEKSFSAWINRRKTFEAERRTKFEETLNEKEVKIFNSDYRGYFHLPLYITENEIGAFKHIDLKEMEALL